MNEKMQVSRAPYWDEMTSDQRIDKLAEAVEILGRTVVELERENCLLKQHRHIVSGELLIPMAHNQVEQPWYKTHLLNRRPRGE